MKTKKENLKVNKNGGVYANGSSKDEKEYINICLEYGRILSKEGSCSIRQLAKHAKVSRGTAKRAVSFYKTGNVFLKKQGRPKCAVGASKGLTEEHDRFIFSCYLKNPCMTGSGYICELKKEFDIDVSESTISRWFHTTGNYKGTLRKASVFPNRKDHPDVVLQVQQFIELIRSVEDHVRIVFSDEKPLKEMEICPDPRRKRENSEVGSWKLRREREKNTFENVC